MLLKNLFAPQPRQLLDMPRQEAAVILAARSWLILSDAREDPLPRVEQYLGAPQLARRFGLLMHIVQQIWPAPFSIHRPCCPVASLDEGLFAAAIVLAKTGARPQFDNLLHEMLGSDARQLLYDNARPLAADYA